MSFQYISVESPKPHIEPERLGSGSPESLALMEPDISTVRQNRN